MSSSSSASVPNSDPIISVDRLGAEWCDDFSQSGATDPLLHMYEFSRRSLLRRDGYIPSFNCSRRASVDSGSQAVPDVIRQVAQDLKKETESVSSFIKEWIDSSDDPHGIILESSPLTSMSPISSSSNPRSSMSGGTPKTSILLSTLISWDNDFLSFTGSELVSRSVKIFDSWGFFDTAMVLLPELTQDSIGSSSAPPPLVQSVGPLVKQKDKFISFMKSVAKNYRASNPYHNFHHAHSVLAIVGNMLRNCTPNWFTQLEEFSILTAAVCHDVGHRGLNSDYYIKTKHELAIQYNDISVLENMHCSLSFDLLLRGSNNFTSDWSEDQFSVFRKIFIQSVLATDMKQHFDLTSKLGEMAASRAPNGAIVPSLLNAEEKKTVFTSLVHAADLANPTMTTKACYDWAHRVVEEMYAQGKLEEKAGYTVAPFMKHPPQYVNEFAKLQISFVGYIVAPLWKAMAAIWPAALNERLDQIEKNNKFWEDMRDRSEKVDSAK